MTDSNGILKRSQGGRFAPGTRPGPGRKPGSPNQTTVDLRMIRDAILSSWDRVNGPELLAQLANERPYDYLRLIASLLPKDRDLTVTQYPLTPANSLAYLEHVRAHALAKLDESKR